MDTPLYSKSPSFDSSDKARRGWHCSSFSPASSTHSNRSSLPKRGISRQPCRTLRSAPSSAPFDCFFRLQRSQSSVGSYANSVRTRQRRIRTPIGYILPVQTQASAGQMLLSICCMQFERPGHTTQTIPTTNPNGLCFTSCRARCLSSPSCW